MGKAANMLEGRATIQSDLNKLEELANRNFTKLNRDKCKASCIWEGKKSLYSITAADWTGSSSAEKALEMLADSKLNISQHAPLKQ